jgi:hypothetical protein
MCILLSRQVQNNEPKTTCDLYAYFLLDGSIKVITGFLYGATDTTHFFLA